jgi:hypothetical protein
MVTFLAGLHLKPFYIRYSDPIVDAIRCGSLLSVRRLV